MNNLTLAKNLTAVKKQITDHFGSEFLPVKAPTGNFLLHKSMGIFQMRISGCFIPGYGEGRVLQPGVRMVMSDFQDLLECMPDVRIYAGSFISPFRMKQHLEYRFRMATHIPYGGEADLEKHKPALLELIQSGIDCYPNISSYEELDALLGPIQSDRLGPLMEQWITRGVEGSAYNTSFETEIPGYPKITLSVWYGAYAYGIWKVLLSKVLDREFEATRSWYQGLLDQGEPDYQAMPYDLEFKERMKMNHDRIYPKICSTFEKLVSQ